MSLPPVEPAATSVAVEARAVRHRVGLLVLATDHTSEADFRRIVADDEVAVHVNRVTYANPTTPENLRRMEPLLTEAAGLILPDETLDAICFSCTSASVVIGDEAVEAAILRAKPGTPVVTPPLAATLGLQALSARRISVLTPYTVETATPMAAYFAGKGFAIDRFRCLGFDDDRVMARIAPASLVEAAKEATHPDSDALFISCTALRAAAIVPAIETAIGKPVVTSNLASAWMCLRLIGDHQPRPAFGTLPTLPLPNSWRCP